MSALRDEILAGLESSPASTLFSVIKSRLFDEEQGNASLKGGPRGVLYMPVRAGSPRAITAEMSEYNFTTDLIIYQAKQDGKASDDDMEAMIIAAQQSLKSASLTSSIGVVPNGHQIKDAGWVKRGTHHGKKIVIYTKMFACSGQMS